MSADTTSNPPNVATIESKSSRKKKAKGEATSTTPVKPESEAGGDAAAQDGKVNGVENASDSPYIKELQKSIRNVNKKLNSMQKVDSIIAENPDQSLDDLVAARKINADQKSQALKKPTLLAQLSQLEEQLTQYKKFDQEYQQKMNTEKELLQSSHKQELEKLQETMKAEAALEAQKASKQRLLVLAKYLRAAAERRQRVDDDTDLAKGFEGVLSMVYSGDASAVAIMEKLIDGVDEPITAVDGTQLKTTYAEVKRTAEEESPFAAEEAWADDVAQADPAPPEVDVDDTPAPTTDAETDPTVANAGLTEVDTITQIATGEEETVELPSAPANASVDDGAANAAGEEQWDSKAPGSDDPLAESFEMIPRDPAETETPVIATDGANVQSWADDAANEAASNEAIATPEPTTTANASDGFREVHHSRGGRGRGGFQGDQRGGFRGRGGPRGEGRGGRGGFRGERGRGRGGPRGGRGRGDSVQ